MTTFPYETALIVGAGSGISASLARRLSALGAKVALAARDIKKLAKLSDETGALAFRAEASSPQQVAELFDRVDVDLGEPDVVIFNASGRLRGAITELDPVAVEDSIICIARARAKRST